MRCFILLFALAGFLFGESLCAGQVMTLEQCLQAGIESNPSLQAARFKVEAAGSDINVARADFFPSLNSSYSASRISSISAKGATTTDYLNQDIHAFNVKMTQILYAGSRVVNNYEKAQIQEQVTRAEMEMAKLELAYNIETTFFKVLKAKQDVLTATESVNRLTESVKAAEAFFRKELVPRVDVLKARVDLADAENQLSIAKNNENRQRVALFSLMDLSSDPDIDFANTQRHKPQERPSFEVSFQSAMVKRPDLKSLEYQTKVADKQSAISLGKYLPVVRLDVGYYNQNNEYDQREQTINGLYTRDQENTYWQTGITLSWDLFDGGRAWFESEKNTLEGTKINALLRDAQNKIATGIRKALYSLEEAEQRMANSTGALAEAKENYKAEENRLKAGVSTITALLDAQSRLIRAQGNAANATLDYQLAQSELKFMTGS